VAIQVNTLQVDGLARNGPIYLFCFVLLINRHSARTPSTVETLTFGVRFALFYSSDIEESLPSRGLFVSTDLR